MNKQILAKLAVWWNEMPEDALDDPVKSYAKLDILASAVPELVENARLRAIIDEFMRLEGRTGNSRRAICARAQCLGHAGPFVMVDGNLNWQRCRSNVSGDEIPGAAHRGLAANTGWLTPMNKRSPTWEISR